MRKYMIMAAAISFSVPLFAQEQVAKTVVEKVPAAVGKQLGKNGFQTGTKAAVAQTVKAAAGAGTTEAAVEKIANEAANLGVDVKPTVKSLPPKVKALKAIAAAKPSEKHIVVLTLDAGGTGLKFGAVCNGIRMPIDNNLPSNAEHLNHFLLTMENGFEAVKNRVKQIFPDAKIVAISFGFPGPADYPNGIIGKVQNFPAIKKRDGLALGPYLSEKFNLPVFINNDAANFALGADATILPKLNEDLAARNDPRRYSNTTAFTLGTGFGSGNVIEGRLLIGDTGSAGEISTGIRSYLNPGSFSEEGVSKRAILRDYAELSGDNSPLTPFEIFKIAERTKPGNAAAAREAFSNLGKNLGDAIATVSGTVDGVVVIGGGIAGAWRYFMPSVMSVLDGSTRSVAGVTMNRTVARFYNMQDPRDEKEFFEYSQNTMKVSGTDREVPYNSQKKLPIFIVANGTENMAQIGAYQHALKNLKLAYIVLPFAVVSNQGGN